MSILFFLIPVGLLFLGLAIWGFVWAVDNGQFEDLDRHGHSILFDDDLAEPDRSEAGPGETAAGHDGSRDGPGDGRA